MNRDWIYPPARKCKKQIKCMKRQFPDTEQQVVWDSDPWDKGNNWYEPYECLNVLLIYLSIVNGCFCAIVTEVNSCDRCSTWPFQNMFSHPCLRLKAVLDIPNKKPSNLNVPQNKHQQYLKEYKTATLSNIKFTMCSTQTNISSM